MNAALWLLFLAFAVLCSLVQANRMPARRSSTYSSSSSTSGAQHNLWQNCGTDDILFLLLSLFWALDQHLVGSEKDHYKIYSASVYPSQPKIGNNITISISGELDETVYFGYGSVVLQWNGYPILNCTKDLYASTREHSFSCNHQLQH